MFLRVVRAAGGKGIKHEYVRVVEAYREHGKTRHRTVLNLGRRDLLAAHLDLNKLMRLLHGEAIADGRVEREDIQAVAAWDWGPMLAARHVWRELGRAWPERRDATPLSDRALVLVANRLAAPGSEAGLPTARIVEKPPTGCGARCSRTVRSLRAAGSDADQCHG
jgi:hypothetical protein